MCEAFRKKKNLALGSALLRVNSGFGQYIVQKTINNAVKAVGSDDTGEAVSGR